MSYIELLAKTLNIQAEVVELKRDFLSLSEEQFYKKHKKWLSKLYDKEYAIDMLEIKETEKSPLFIDYFVANGYFASIDWSGEEYVGQVKRFITNRLKKLGVTPIKINDKQLQKDTLDGKVKRGDYLSQLLTICHKALLDIGYSIMMCDAGIDSEIFTVLTNKESDDLCKLSSENFIFDTPTLYDLYLEEVSKEDRTKMMMYLKHTFSTDNITAKNMVDNLPLKVATGLKSEIFKRKNSMESIATVKISMELSEE